MLKIFLWIKGNQIYKKKKSGVIRIFFLKRLTIWSPLLPVFQSTECLIPNFHLEFLSGGVEGQQRQWPWFNLCGDRWQVPISSWQSPFRVTNLIVVWGHYRTILSHSARSTHSQVWWRFHWQATQRASSRLGHKTKRHSKFFRLLVLPNLVAQGHIPLIDKVRGSYDINSGLKWP